MAEFTIPPLAVIHFMVSGRSYYSIPSAIKIQYRTGDQYAEIFNFLNTGVVIACI
jgi:hypothetical protein